MAQEESLAALTQLLSSYQAFITYQPLRSEADFSFLSFPPHSFTIEIPARASLDPLELAGKMTALSGTLSTAILIPGRMFDASGTRHGQGGGWYDRFLANVPREWLRVGFCFSDQLSPTPLKRESWDQAMDYVVAVDRETKAITLLASEGAMGE
jgi:5-formyltetrahydrofolate cyclo-ligase